MKITSITIAAAALAVLLSVVVANPMPVNGRSSGTVDFINRGSSSRDSIGQGAETFDSQPSQHDVTEREMIHPFVWVTMRNERLTNVGSHAGPELYDLVWRALDDITRGYGAGHPSKASIPQQCYSRENGEGELHNEELEIVVNAHGWGSDDASRRLLIGSIASVAKASRTRRIATSGLCLRIMLEAEFARCLLLLESKSVDKATTSMSNSKLVDTVTSTVKLSKHRLQVICIL
ncbi:hypothetical protein BDV96DRAFT_685645 [Lophiotrema nucula]|uniref:Uncharacterized protein n=1 Tax=Lophiotrema nucula TaxID=690887 RepID=A0A6A5ZI02_9PLEO|nr:hypothetical protein BDV96DRAFT_685645 [Lophiotrema nucula]